MSPLSCHTAMRLTAVAVLIVIQRNIKLWKDCAFSLEIPLLLLILRTAPSVIAELRLFLALDAILNYIVVKLRESNGNP
jgi:hypothetical protein